jgi:hypothetical protein
MGTLFLQDEFKSINITNLLLHQSCNQWFMTGHTSRRECTAGLFRIKPNVESTT